MRENVAIPTSSGRLYGTDAGNGITAFRGIPYAQAPVGKRRFASPAPLNTPEQPRDCAHFAAACPQITLPAEYLAPIVCVDPAETDEAACLNLNVWAPEPADGQARPVMVYIHGGAFSLGAGSLPMYDGTTFARSGVVYVSINYRVGPLGWLYLDQLFPGAEGTGNLGLLDQVAALGWVRDNIAAFGGDPANVTIFGESAGAFSVATLLAVPAAKGLFRRAIVQSGSARQNLRPPAATRVTEYVLREAGIAPGDWDALRSIDAQKLADSHLGCWVAVADLLHDEPGAVRKGSIPLSPVVDGVVLPLLAEEAVAGGAAADVDLLVGTCADEFRGLQWDAPPGSPFLVSSDYSEFLLPLEREHEKIREVYADEHQPTGEEQVVAAVGTDACFAVPTAALALAQSRHGRAWMYRLEWRTPVDDFIHGAPHALDVPLVFEHLTEPVMHGDNPPVALASEMHNAWVRFASTGDPNGGTLPDWPLYESRDRTVMLLDENCRLGTDFSPAVRSLWGMTEP